MTTEEIKKRLEEVSNIPRLQIDRWANAYEINALQDRSRVEAISLLLKYGFIDKGQNR